MPKTLAADGLALIHVVYLRIITVGFLEDMPGGRVSTMPFKALRRVQVGALVDHFATAGCVDRGDRTLCSALDR